VPAPSEDAEGGALATNQAVKKVLEQVASFVVKHVE